MDFKQLLKWVLKRWWWFVISVVVCLGLGSWYYFTATPRFNVRAVLMIRQVASEDGASPDEMMQAMGFRENKVVGDEVKVLTSRDLIGRVVDELDLCTTYAKVYKGRWTEQYPYCDLKATMDYTKPQPVTVEVKVKTNGKYRVKVKWGMASAKHFTLSDLSQPIHTKIGDLNLSMCDTVTQGKFRAVITPRICMVDQLTKQITVTRLGRESKIINLTTTTDSPSRMVATINTILAFYNQESTEDKNLIAVQTEQFLADRIQVVMQELNEAETAVEAYKRMYQIADLSKVAEKYQEMGENYKLSITGIDATLRLIDYINEQINKSENEFTMLPLLSDNGVVNDMISGYNGLIARRDILLQTATTQNTVVVKEEELLRIKRANIREAIAQDAAKLKMERQNLVNQQNLYAELLASLPETERRYVEMCRDKATKEKQYVYLIEKREENAMQLSSEAVPARIVESAQIDPNVASPKLKLTFLVALFFGMLLPLLVYFFELFRKEFL